MEFFTVLTKLGSVGYKITNITTRQDLNHTRYQLLYGGGQLVTQVTLEELGDKDNV